MLKNLSVGVHDWQAASLIKDYYPEGLPQEWRFDYYLNEYHAVLVAQSEWLVWQQADINELLMARRDGTALYLAIDDRQNCKNSEVTRLCNDLGDWLAGFVVFDELWPEQDRTWFDRPVTWVSRHQAWSGWQWHSDGWILSGAPCGWLEDLTAEPKAQAALLRDFVKSLPDKNTAVPFFIVSQSINMNRLQNLKTLAELLGY